MLILQDVLQILGMKSRISL